MALCAGQLVASKPSAELKRPCKLQEHVSIVICKASTQLLFNSVHNMSTYKGIHTYRGVHKYREEYAYIYAHIYTKATQRGVCTYREKCTHMQRW